MAAFRDASGRSWLAVADIGDNQAQRSSVEVDVVPEPARPGDVVEPPRLRLRLRYPDGPRDAETLLVDGARRRMFVVSKGLLTGTVYAAAGRPPGTAGVPAGADDAVGDARAGGNRPADARHRRHGSADGTVLLRTYGELAAFDPFPLEAGTRLLTPRATAALPSQQQGEGLALAPGGRSVLLSSEGTDQPVLRFALPADLGRRRRDPACDAGPDTVPPRPWRGRSDADPALVRDGPARRRVVVGLAAAVAALGAALGVRRARAALSERRRVSPRARRRSPRNAVSASTSSGSIAGNIATRSWLRPSLR